MYTIFAAALVYSIEDLPDYTVLIILGVLSITIGRPTLSAVVFGLILIAMGWQTRK